MVFDAARPIPPSSNGNGKRPSKSSSGSRPVSGPVAEGMAGAGRGQSLQGEATQDPSHLWPWSLEMRSAGCHRRTARRHQGRESIEAFGERCLYAVYRTA